MNKKISRRYRQVPFGGLSRLMKTSAYQECREDPRDVCSALDRLFVSMEGPPNTITVPMNVRLRVKEAVIRPQILSDIMRKNAGNRRRQARGKR